MTKKELINFICYKYSMPDIYNLKNVPRYTRTELHKMPKLDLEFHCLAIKIENPINTIRSV